MEMQNYQVDRELRSSNPDYPGCKLYLTRTEDYRSAFILAAVPLKKGDVITHDRVSLIPDMTYLNSPTYSLKT